MAFIQVALKKYIQQTLVDEIKHAFKLNSRGNLNIDVLTEFPKSLVQYPTIIVGEVTGDTYRFIGEPFLEANASVNATLIDGMTSTITNSVDRGGFFNIQVLIHVAGRTSEERRNALDLVTIFLRDLYKDRLSQAGLTLVDLDIVRGRTEKIGNDYIYFDILSVRYFVRGWKEKHTRGVDFSVVESIIKEMIITQDGSCQSF